MSGSESNPAGRHSRQITLRLRDDILSGRMAAGLRLTEAGLAERFGVGRGPVRDAVKQLSVQGLLVLRPNRGAAVAPEPSREIRQLITPIRRTIEAYALRQVFDELTDADFGRWESIVERMRNACEARDLHTLAELDLAFHRALLERAAQPELLVIWDTLVGQIRTHFRRMQRRTDDLLSIYDEHKALLDSFRTGKLAESLRLLKAKIE